ncbi:maleylpyruvate isomerase family mycothiol-dependent enzyme [Rhodococcus spelaei]|uniref:Maleylpyruvate isomerase family mycothiol-dependent enzyme n=1 Tax=Rhodococcus spelaei TaxID=2546320 RepID=A0A541BRF8_9NOCA|nr:maleylpyruvate isomerase family mycothiol-dependent enzyme [Rhodococcus spelaei]TQF74905.1 maleylpyruvate isomerase family mycothiol-dependent enzyme [Rhodococcus spelaei]
MSAPSPWPVIHAERAALADDLASLTDDQWSSPSLCPGWSVWETLGHMTATAKMTPPKFFLKMLGTGFRFESFAAKNIAAETSRTPADTLAEFRRVATSTSAPPGPVDSWLGETIVHAEDIRRPLGIAHTYPQDAVVRVADFYKGSNLLIGAKSRIEGLTLRATDTAWTIGSGPEVSGPILALLLAMTGRSAALDELSGEGLATLRERG